MLDSLVFIAAYCTISKILFDSDTWLNLLFGTYGTMNNTTVLVSPFTKDDIYKTLYDWVGLTYPVLILLFGTLGNCLNFFILGRACPGTSIAVLLRSMAIANLVDIWFYIFPLWMRVTFGVKLKESSRLACKVIPFINYTGTDCAIFLVVLSNLDRFVAIWFPMKMSKFCNTKNALMETLLAFVFSVLINITAPLTKSILSDGSCDTEKNWLYNYQTYVHPWIIFALVSVTPEIAVILLNSCIACGIFRHNKMMRDMTVRTITTRNAATNRSSAAFKNDSATLVLTLGISLMFVVLYTPILLLNSFESQFSNKRLFRVISIVFSMLQHTFHSIDFYIYLGISTSYRRKFLKVMCNK